MKQAGPPGRGCLASSAESAHQRGDNIVTRLLVSRTRRVVFPLLRLTDVHCENFTQQQGPL